MSYPTFLSDELSQQKAILYNQVINIGILIVAGLGVGVFTYIFPAFFRYPYFNWGGWESVWRFWPMFAWGVIVATLLTFLNGPICVSENNKLLQYRLLSSVLAGVWEELGFRWIFICYSMIFVVLGNWIFGAGLGWVLMIGFAFATVTSLSQRKFLFAVLAAIGVAIAIWFAQNANIVYWFYENVLVVIIHFTTFDQMDSVLNNQHDRIFLFGAILANAWFRDGHKYQGPLGVINSWYCGLVLLYATVTYGVITAIAVHTIYDLIHSIIYFVFRKTK